MKRKFGKAAVRRRIAAKLTPSEQKMTLAALARPCIGIISTVQKREESDRPEREADLIAEAIRRRNERLEGLKLAFSQIVVKN